MLQEPCLQGILPSHALSCLGCKGLAFAWVAAAKNQFFTLWFFFPHETQTSLALQKNQAPKNDFSPRCSHETQTSPALQKTIFQALKNYFFRMPLVKSANSTSCSKNLRDPGPQAFGFLTSSRTVIYIYISEFQPEVPFPRPSDAAVPPDLQAHRIRVASRPGQVPGTSPTNLVYDTPVEVRADPAVVRLESEISTVCLLKQCGLTSLHVSGESLQILHYHRCRAWQMCSGA